LKQYLWNLLLWADQGLNTLLGGDPDETLSSRSGKAQAKGIWWGCCFCRLLDIFDKDHCKNNIELDEGSNAVFPV
jgi:hypothetical protein